MSSQFAPAPACGDSAHGPLWRESCWIASFNHALIEALKPGDVLVSRTGTRWTIAGIKQGAFTTFYTLNREGTRRNLVRTDHDLLLRWSLVLTSPKSEAPPR